MAIREQLAALAARPRVEKRMIEGLGEVGFRRLTASDVLAIEEEGREFGVSIMREALLDEGGEPLFLSNEALVALDWSIYRALQTANLEINGINIPAAEKK